MFSALTGGIADGVEVTYGVVAGIVAEVVARAADHGADRIFTKEGEGIASRLNPAVAHGILAATTARIIFLQCEEPILCRRLAIGAEFHRQDIRYVGRTPSRGPMRNNLIIVFADTSAALVRLSRFEGGAVLLDGWSRLD